MRIDFDKKIKQNLMFVSDNKEYHVCSVQNETKILPCVYIHFM